MHKLHRPALPQDISDSLRDAIEHELRWDDYNKKPLRSFLRTVVQTGLCAYCERRLSAQDSQTRIDHFVPRSSDAGKTQVFEWENLFLSCDDPDTCDNHKRDDERKIINPTIDDPREYLTFTATGMVIPVSGLDDVRSQKAKNTIDVLNLKNPTLCNRRVLAFNRFRKQADRSHASFRQGVPSYYEFCTFCNTMLSSR